MPLGAAARVEQRGVARTQRARRVAVRRDDHLAFDHVDGLVAVEVPVEAPRGAIPDPHRRRRIGAARPPAAARDGRAFDDPAGIDRGRLQYDVVQPYGLENGTGHESLPLLRFNPA
ncbi:hypothetical protein X941_5744 [Burkholderia pseudomallei MSHR5569]|nr:hypothetical protein X941_5744 [Burkholderia pseudomallei MSHR5569]